MKQNTVKQEPGPLTLEIAGIPVEVVKKKIKNVYLRVRAADGRVSVSAPLGMSDAQIGQFVRAKARWIQKHAGAYANRPRPEPRAYETGKTLVVWGRPYHLETVPGSRYALTLSPGWAVLTVRRNDTGERRERFVREWYREQLKAETARLLPKWERITGLQAAGWQTKYMTTRWGTCNTKTRKIWLNAHLAKKPTECLEYILLHELAHLAERRHGARFYALMDKYMPSWRTVKAALNQRRFE